MNPAQILLQRLAFVLDPIGQFPGQARKLTSIHHDAVIKFRSAASLLTQPGTDILKGETAKAFDAIVSEYFCSEALFTGSGTMTNTGGMEEAAVACERLQEDIVRTLSIAYVKFAIDDGLEAILDQILERLSVWVAAIDLSAALQGFIDVPDDVAAGIVTGIEATIVAIEVTIKVNSLLTELKDLLTELAQDVQRWQNEIQRLKNQPLPSLPPTPFTISETASISY